MRAQLDDIVEGYQEFADFDQHETALIEPLRTLRIMHYAGWLARRWDDPAFPRAFPWKLEPVKLESKWMCSKRSPDTEAPRYSRVSIWRFARGMRLSSATGFTTRPCGTGWRAGRRHSRA